MSRFRRPLLLLKAASLLALTLGTATVASAQSTRTQSASVSFASGRGGSGFASARVVVRYAFLNCFGAVTVAWQLDRSSLQATLPYYLNGEPIDAANDGVAGPAVINVVGTVRRGPSGFVATVRTNLTDAPGLGCYGETKEVGRVADLVGAGATPPQIEAYLNSLSLSIADLNITLRSLTAESAHRARTQASADSARRIERERLEELRRDSLAARARADSLIRAATRDSVLRATQRDSIIRAAARDTSRHEALRDSLQRMEEASRERRRRDAERVAREQREAQRRAEQDEVARRGYATGTALFMQAEGLYQAGQQAAAAQLYRMIAYEPGWYLPEQREVARQRLEQLAYADLAGSIIRLGDAIDPVMDKVFNAFARVGIGFSMGTGFGEQMNLAFGVIWRVERVGAHIFWPMAWSQLGGESDQDVEPPGGTWDVRTGWGADLSWYFTRRISLGAGMHKVVTTTRYADCSYCADSVVERKSIWDPTGSLTIPLGRSESQIFARYGAASGYAFGFKFVIDIVQ